MNLPDLHFEEGLPNASLFDPKTRNLVVIDDLMAESDGWVTTLFAKKSHHTNTSVIYLVQNLFPKNKESRTISPNAHYMVVFKIPHDKSQISHLARQMHPGRVKFVHESFNDATAVQKQETPEDLRLRRSIFPYDDVQYVYLPKV